MLRQSIIIMLICEHSLHFSQQLIDFLIDVAYVLAVAFVLPLLVLLLVGLFILRAEFVFNFRLLLALLFDQQLLDGRYCSGNGLFVLQDVVKFRIR